MRATFDPGDLLSGAQQAARAACGIVAHNILSDCADFVPYETGALRRSGRVDEGSDKVSVTWGGDEDTSRYARVQYFGVGLSHDTAANHANAPRARHHWFEGARAEREQAWRDMFAREFTRRLR